MTAWTKFVTKFYNDKKKHDKNYMFKHALIGAAKVYKKGGSNQGEGEHDEHDKQDKQEGGNGGNGEEPAENQEMEVKPELMEQEGGKKKARKAKKSAKKSRKTAKKSRKSSRKARK